MLKVFHNTPFRELELKLYSITILRTVLSGEIIVIWGVDNVHYEFTAKFSPFITLNLPGLA